MLAGSPKPSELGPIRVFPEALASASRAEVCALGSFSVIARATDGLGREAPKGSLDRPEHRHTMPVRGAALPRGKGRERVTLDEQTRVISR